LPWRGRCEESIALYGANIVPETVAVLGAVALAEGDPKAARQLCEAGLALSLAQGESFWIALAQGWLGTVALEEGDTVAARALYTESLALYGAQGTKWYSAESTLSLGLVAYIDGQLDQAAVRFAAGVAQCHTLGAKHKVATGLAGLALVAASRAAAVQAVPSAQRAARLAGATAGLLDALHAPLDRQFRKPHQGAIASARAILGDEAFDATWEAGRQLTLDEAVAFALSPQASPF
jgi:hypothetical protein